MLLNTPSKIVFTKPTIGKVLNYCISHSETLMIMQTTQFFSRHRYSINYWQDTIDPLTLPHIIKEAHKRTKGGALWAVFVKLVPIDMAVCSDHADSFELDHFDKNFHLIFWLKSE